MFRKKLLFLFLCLPFLVKAQQPQKIQWENETLMKGIVWKHAADSLFGGAQYLNLLVVKPKKRKPALSYHPSELQKTSKMAERKAAKAAVNAGFFDTKKGGSVTYIKVDGKVLDADTTGRWHPHQLLNGAISIHQNGEVVIRPEGSHQVYDAASDLQHVLVTGPLLLQNGEKVALPKGAFSHNRHPRTCACTNGKKLLLLTVDGRNAQAVGMSLPELQTLLVSLGCKDAINLDGGGSTTMWLSGKGVVNMPSDNKKFDHEGERAVSSILLIY